jgi:demethylmenaquinone methyltransferase/2-methoxy-6-polyprenyl-1,4-benzoquinol methylase
MHPSSGTPRSTSHPRRSVATGNTRIDPRHRFNLIARSGLYDPLTALSFGRAGRRLHRELVEATGLEPGGQVLDVACGPGRNLPLLLDAVGPGGRVVGVDISASMLVRARSRAVDAELLEADISEGLPFGDAMFDAVVSSFGLSCVPRISPALDEILRVLRPDGVLAVADARMVNWHPRPLGALVTAAVSPFNSWYPERDLAAMVEGRGLAVERLETSSDAFVLFRARRAA